MVEFHPQTWGFRNNTTEKTACHPLTVTTTHPSGRLWWINWLPAIYRERIPRNWPSSRTQIIKPGTPPEWFTPALSGGPQVRIHFLLARGEDHGDLLLLDWRPCVKNFPPTKKTQSLIELSEGNKQIVQGGSWRNMYSRALSVGAQ